MAYNYSKLLGRITERFGSQAKFSKHIGISEHSISKKLNNQVDWRQCEINKACELLGIPKEEIHDYFFNLEVQFIQTF